MSSYTKTLPLTDGADTCTTSEDGAYTASITGAKPAGVGVCAVQGLVTSYVKQSRPIAMKCGDIATDSGFSNIVATSGQVSGSEHSSDTVNILLTWAPSSAGTYYARIGAQGQSPYNTWSYATTSFVVGFPTIISLSPTIKRNLVTLTLTVQDTYLKPPNVTMQVDGEGIPAAFSARSGSGPYYYVFTATVEVETGEHRIAAVIGNVWTTVTMAESILYVPAVPYPARIEVYQGSQLITTENISLVERFLPDVAEAQFDVGLGVRLSGSLILKQWGNGLRIHRMTVTSQTERTVTCASEFSTVLNTSVRVQAPAMANSDLVQSIIAPARLVGRTDLLSGTRELIDVEDQVGNILTSVATVCGVQLYERNRKVYVMPITADNTDTAVAISSPPARRSVDYKPIVNRIRQYYALEQFPVPDTVMTDHDAAHWTGTVSDVLTTNKGLVPRGTYCAKITGLAKHNVAFSLNDYDYVVGSFAPEQLGQTLEVRLYSSANDYWKVSRYHAGGTLSGFSVSGGYREQEVPYTINFTAARLAVVTIRTTQPCLCKIALLRSGVTVYSTDYRGQTDNGAASFGIPESIYTGDPVDGMTITFTQLYQVGTGYGAQVVSCSGQEYYSYMDAQPTGEVVAWTQKQRFSWGGATLVGPDYQTLVCPFFPEGPVAAVPADAKVGATRYWLHVTFWKAGRYEMLSSYDTAIPPGNGEHPSYQKAWIQDSQLYLGVWAGVLGLYVPIEQVATIETFAEITLYGTKMATKNVQMWSFRLWQYGSSYADWDTFTLPLTDKQIGYGTPSSDIIAIGATLTLAGTFYLDALAVRAKDKRWRSVEVKDVDSANAYGDRFMERKLDAVYSETSAKTLANGLLALLKDPAVTYEATIAGDSDIALGDAVTTNDGMLEVTMVEWRDGTCRIEAGKPYSSLRDKLATLARKQDALQRIL
jgi:hypothetical protein